LLENMEGKRLLFKKISVCVGGGGGGGVFCGEEKEGSAVCIRRRLERGRERLLEPDKKRAFRPGGGKSLAASTLERRERWLLLASDGEKKMYAQAFKRGGPKQFSTGQGEGGRVTLRILGKKEKKLERKGAMWRQVHVGRLKGEGPAFSKGGNGGWPTLSKGSYSNKEGKGCNSMGMPAPYRRK